MNVLFLTMVKIEIEQRDIYNDLMRHFRDKEHKVFIVTPVERREGKKTFVSKVGGVTTLFVRTLNVRYTNIIEKGIGQITLEYLYKYAIKRHLNDVSFDLVLYSTPPIAFNNVIKYVKSKNPKAKSYLMLKDIFPQNAIDIGMLSTNGVKGLLYKTFKKKERALYDASDFIGCMSPANVSYIKQHNPEINPCKIEIAPNSIELSNVPPLSKEERNRVLEKYNLPTDIPIFIYGGNLGKPQGIPFLVECLSSCKNRKDCHFLIVGGGSEYPVLEEWVKNNNPHNVSLFTLIPKVDYDQLVRACNVGLIFIDYRFTIPNYPSRLLPYLENKMPIIACTDPNCDTGSIAEDNEYGFWVPSNNANAFYEAINKMLESDMITMGQNGYEFLKSNYLVEHTYNAIVKHF